MAVEPRAVNPNDNSSEAAVNREAQIDDILKRMDALPTIDTRPEDEILGY